MATPIKVQILGDAKGLQTALGQAQAQLKAFGLASNKGKLLAGGAATAIVGLGVAAAKMALDMDQAKKDFELSTGLMGEAADDAFQQVLDAAGQVPDSIDAVIEAGGNLATTTGFLGENLEDLTVQFMDLNRLGFGAVSENQVGEMFKTWGLEGQDATDMLDNLAEVSQATGVDIGMLSDLVTSNAGAFMKWGLDGEEAVQMLGQWEKAGIDSNKVVRGLNSNIDMLTSQGKDTTQMLEDMTKVMDDGNISAEEATLLYDLFGAEATDVIAQLEAGTISLKDFDEEMGMSGQTVQEMTDASATVGEKFAELRNKIMVKLAPALVRLGELLIQAVDWFIEDALPAIQKFSQDTVEFFKDIYQKVKPILDGIMTYFEGIWETIQGIWEAFSSIFRGDFKGFWNGIKKIFSGVLKAMKGILKAQWEAMKLYVKEVLGRIKDIVVGRFNAIKDAMVKKITNAKDAVVNKIKELPGDAREALSDMVRAVRDKGTSAFNAFKSIGNKMLDGLKEALNSAAGFAGDVASGVLQAVKNVINTQVIDRINSALDFTIPIKFAPDIRINPPDIPRLAFGGSIAGGKVALVGERGPELVKIPNSIGGANVVSNREMKAGGGDIHVHVGGSNATPGQIGQAVVWAMRQGG